jgi:uncharacterized cupredoxin-like copper-binding protein
MAGMGRRWLAVALIAVALASGSYAGLSFAGTVAQTTVYVVEKEWTVKASRSTVSAGKVVFRVRNTGRAAHKLIVLKTNLPPRKLINPRTGWTTALEPGRMAGTRLLLPGQRGKLTLTLKPGHYLLICNQAGHFHLGMHTGLTVSG